MYAPKQELSALPCKQITHWQAARIYWSTESSSKNLSRRSELVVLYNSLIQTYNLFCTMRGFVTVVVYDV